MTEIEIDYEARVEYDDRGRPIVKYCPLCGKKNPGGIWRSDEHASIGKCAGCGQNVIIDIGPARRDPEDADV